MKNILVSYLIDNENMTDEEYENQEEKEIKISAPDLYDILTYGRFNNQVILSEGESISEITNVTIEYT